MITKNDVVKRIAEYLHHESSLEELVDWAEDALMDEPLEPNSEEVLASVIARLGLTDVRAFGLTWDDCEDLLQKLGYQARVEITK